MLTKNGHQWSKDAIHGFLKAAMTDLVGCRQAHSLIINNGFSHVNILNDQLIRLFASFGSLWEANLVFCSVAYPSQFTWEAIIAAHANFGHNLNAVELYRLMQEEGITPNRCIFLAVLKACADIDSVEHGRVVHDQIIGRGLISDVAVVNTLIDMYAKSGCLDEARKLFDEFPNKDVVSFGAMIAGYTSHGYGFLALELFESLHYLEIKPDKVTFISTLKACSSVGALRQGRLIHIEIVRRDLGSDVVISSAIIDMYAKCGTLEDARKVFDNLPQRNLVCWGAMITGYVQNGHEDDALTLYESMQVAGFKPDKVNCLCALKACGSIGAVDCVRLIHGELIERGFFSDPVMRSTVVDIYSKCELLQDAHSVFLKSPKDDLITSSTLVAAYCQHGHFESAVALLQTMQQGGREVNEIILACIMKALSDAGEVRQGRLIHDQIIKSGFEMSVVLGSTIVDMYSKCGSLQEARKVFDALPNRDVVLWGSMIVGYTQHGCGLPALQLFDEMQQKFIKTSNVIISSIVKACGSIGALEEGRLIHDQIIKDDLHQDVVIANSLVDMYVNCGNLTESYAVFNHLSNIDIVSWNAMIIGYAQHGLDLAALQLFERMQEEGSKPDNVTFCCVLRLCGSMGLLAKGRLVHNQILKYELETAIDVGSILVDLYATCGSLKEAEKVFGTLSTHNSVSWCAIIAGHAQNGNWRFVRDSIQEMQCQGLKLDDRISTLMLSACSQAGQLEQGNGYFNSMKPDHGLVQSVEHFNCLIDGLSRAGQLHEAAGLLETMPLSPDITGWMSLLTACKKFANPDVGRRCFNRIIHTDPDVSAAYVFMSNIYSDAHMWESADEIQELKRCANAWKKPGRALIEVGNSWHEIVVGDQNHNVNSEVFVKIKRLVRQLENDGYMPQQCSFPREAVGGL